MMNSKKSPRSAYRRFISQQEPRVILFSNQLHDSVQVLSEQDRLGLLKIFREETDLVGGLILNFAVREKEIGLLLKLGDPSQSLSVDDAGNRLEKVWPEEKVIAWKNSLLAADPDSDAAKGLWHMFRQPIQDEGQYFRRMMRRASSYINHRQQTNGTVWVGKAKTLSVEPSALALFTVSAYLDFSGLRDQSCDRVEDDLFCGFGAAGQGDRKARAGMFALLDVMQPPHGANEVKEKIAFASEPLGMDPKGFGLKGSNWEVFSRFYSSWLDPGLSAEVRNKRNPNRAESAKLWEVLRKDSVSAFPYKTFRWMTHGGALGSKEFIETLFMAYRDQFSPERKQGARRIAGNWGGLCTLRQTVATK